MPGRKVISGTVIKLVSIRHLDTKREGCHKLERLKDNYHATLFG